MASFAAKRKARVIKVDEEEISSDNSPSGTDLPDTKKELGTPILAVKSSRKPFRQSGLRKAFNANDESGVDATSGRLDEDEEDDGPVVVRPSINRAGSTKQKKKPATKSRLSFGGDTDHGDAEEFATPQKSGLGKRALENSAVRRGIALRTLPSRSAEEAEADRPRYSKEYLEELQSSTPSTPRDVSTLHPSEGDDMELDLSELDGAVVVEYPGPASPKSPKSGTPQILSEAEIRERKERRARLAKEHDVLSLEDDDSTTFSRKKEKEGRLLAEDEDLGEGFDSYVEDGGLSLGKRAEKERRKKGRQQMAELISAAEGHSSDDSSDSEAERRMAYEASQSKAGLDGLKKPQQGASHDLLQVPPKITPLPSVSECLARLQMTLKAMESDLKTKTAHLEHLRKEREEIDKRKAEVQSLLDETGKKYQEAMRRGNVEPGGAATPGGLNAGLVGERGLDSLGTTPRRPSQTEEMDVT
ncbi:hypothetical protein E4U43_004066 [Claviceps pusilla]|uniref:Nineteen complex-related protein 2-domain-containing protein n=1 Tax=Claviceps pusilla TaxID=123648 RepID=A0A9P7N4D4_9HYPO|nr:hypothetical protein E4U43_004066 [Claviceps pusilla]